jgi:hypothetical protein
MPVSGEKLQDRARDTALALPGVSHGRPFTDGVTPVIEIGGTHVTAALVGAVAGRVRQGTVRHSPLGASASAEEVLGTIAQCARALGDGPAT